jgi:hypothetical protein
MAQVPGSGAAITLLAPAALSAKIGSKNVVICIVDLALPPQNTQAGSPTCDDASDAAFFCMFISFDMAVVTAYIALRRLIKLPFESRFRTRLL